MAVPDVRHFYEEELANNPFKMNPGIIMGHDKVEVSKAQQVINSSNQGTHICIVLLDPSADTLQTWYFALRNIGGKKGSIYTQCLRHMTVVRMKPWTSWLT
eukprot:16429760-Heterocapsa_arctica.AAC.1